MIILISGLMGANLETFRAALGMFNSLKFTIFKYIYYYAYIRIILSNDIELNPGPVTSFSLGDLNARSLNIRDKFDEISFLIRENNFDVFAVSETWLHERISGEFLSVPGYNPIIRLDRGDRLGGSVAFFTTDSLVVKQRKDLEIAGFELLWIEFRVKQHYFLCGVCYRPPDNDCTSLSIFLNNFQITLDKIRLLPRKYILVILGDLNAHYNNMYHQDSTDIGRQIHRFLEGNSLSQLITEPTRVIRQQATILDVIITNCPNFFVSTGTLSPPSNCDHSVIFAKMNIQFYKCYSFKREIWNFNNVDTINLNKELLGTKWHPSLENATDIDEVYDVWFTLFRTIIEKYIPLKSVIIRHRDKPWMNSEVRRAIRKRDRLLRTHNRKLSGYSWESYRRQRNFTTNLIRLTKKRYYQRLNKELSDPGINFKKWWSITKRLCGSSNVSSILIIVENGVAVTDPKEKACIFNDYFIAQTQLPGADSATPPEVLPFQSVAFLSNIWVIEEEILTLMRGVDVSKGSGYDGIGNKIVRLCSEGLCSFFTTFVNLSFALGQFPSRWKLSNVIPLFKKDNRQLKINYRPVWKAMTVFSG